jgi:hypothetical protein
VSPAKVDSTAELLSLEKVIHALNSFAGQSGSCGELLALDKVVQALNSFRWAK